MKKIALLSILLFLAVAGCKATKNYPDPFPGWHSADYSTVFGRLQLIPAKAPENPPVWVVRFGLGSDRYGGEFALTPPEKLVGYAGGEQVEIKGAVHPELSHPDYPGNWYQIQSIKLWSNYH